MTIVEVHEANGCKCSESDRVVVSKVGAMASHEEQLKSMSADLLDMFPVPYDILRSRRQSRTGHSVKTIDSHDNMQDIVGSADRADKDNISTASDSFSQVLNVASDMSAASDSISQVLSVANHGHYRDRRSRKPWR